VNDARSLRDQVELLTRSLDDARAEHARGELDDDALAQIEARDGARLAAATARLAEVAAASPTSPASPSPSTGPRRRPRWLLGVAAGCLAAVLVVLVLAATDPFAQASHATGPFTKKATAELLVFQAETFVQERHYLQALTTYEAVLRLEPHDAEALIEEGWLRYEYVGRSPRRDVAEIDLGAAELARAVRLAPNHGAAHLYDGIVLFQHHDDRGARAQFIRAAQLPENKVDAKIDETFLYYLSR
jgi:tetratricopeptide (TPR) repeat protein